LIENPDRKFILQLALAWGQPLEYIESLPFEVISEFKALNAWSPFTPEREANQLGLIASMMSHQVYKKGKSATELFPYLQSGVPDFLEDERVAKARALIKNTTTAPEQIRTKQLETITNAIRDEIEIERSSDSPDLYVIRQLTNMIN
jgi:hypothetical protein